MIFWYLVFLPLLGIISLLAVKEHNKNLIRNIALGFSLLTLFLNIWLLFLLPDSLMWAEHIPWFSPLGLDFSVSIDAFNFYLILLTTFLTSIVMLASYSQIKESVRGFHILLLLLEASMIGVFIASNLWVFYIFWEIMLIPMYFIIGIWGSDDREHAAIKFVLFTLGGSLFMLLGILALGYFHFQEFGFYSFALEDLKMLSLPFDIQKWIFVGLFLGFAVKIPLVPLHVWLPDAHGQAPTAGSVILASVLLKMGVYGFIRIAMPLTPDAIIYFQEFIAIISVIGIIYGAMLALAQTDIKRLIAYSSISHLGFCMLGIISFTPQGFMGGVLQVFNHGISTGALFLLAGMLYERTHTKGVHDFGGLAHHAPRYTVFFALATLSSIGLPGLNNFIGEFLCLLGAFNVYPILASIGACGVILAAGYMLLLFKRVFYGEKKEYHFGDLGRREIALLLPLIIMIFWIGVYPKPFLAHLEPTNKELLKPILEVMDTEGSSVRR